MVSKSLVEFIEDKYKNSRYPSLRLPIKLINLIGVENIFDEDIKQYKMYLQRMKELETVPKYAL